MSESDNYDHEAKQLAHFRAVAKRELRARMRSVRNVLPQAARAARSAAVVARVLELPEFARAQTVISFSAIQKEVDPAEVLVRALALGKRVGLPCVVEDRLVLREQTDPSALEPGAFGVLEPPASAAIIDPQTVGLVLVPGLAFDTRGHRIGYGRAFYDRLLPLLPHAFRVGIGFDFQLVPELPNEEHDIALQCVISDARCLRI
jgi:5-formyltetrahydrofolate cyclo-ligase